MTDDLLLSFDVGCGAEHAFTTWTQRMSAWWPRDHTMSGAPGVEVVLEPRVGGRIFERAPDGSELDWGEVTAWEPPRRLGYLWHIGAGRADATDVEIAFHPLDARTTRVEIRHGGWERLGEDTRHRRRGLNVHGWEVTISAYRDACAGATTA